MMITQSARYDDDDDDDDDDGDHDDDYTHMTWHGGGIRCVWL